MGIYLAPHRLSLMDNLHLGGHGNTLCFALLCAVFVA